MGRSGDVGFGFQEDHQGVIFLKNASQIHFVIKLASSIIIH
jgi:hypothetical protein